MKILDPRHILTYLAVLAGVIIDRGNRRK